MNQKTGFLEESPGNRSITRLIFLIGMLWLMWLCSVALLKCHATLIEIGTLFTMVAGVLAGLKIWQNNQEKTKAIISDANLNAQGKSPPEE